MRALRSRFARRRGASASAESDAPAATGAAPEPAAAARLSPRVRVRRIASGLDFALQAIGVARRLRPAIVHANDWNTMWAGIAIKLSCGSKLIYDSHELWPDRNGRWERRGWLMASEALFVRMADERLTTSPGHAAALATRYRIATPPVVRNIPERRERTATAPDEPPVIAYVGGLMPGRGIEQMIDALVLLDGVRLRAVGPGSAGYRAGLLRRATELGVLDRVELVDPVPPGDVPEALAGAVAGLCLIQPLCLSYELSLPNKLFEYAAAGLPVIASDLPVIGEVVRANGLGPVVPAADRTALAAAVKRLLDPSQRALVVAHVLAFASANPREQEAALLAEVYRRLLQDIPADRPGALVPAARAPAARAMPGAPPDERADGQQHDREQDRQ